MIISLNVDIELQPSFVPTSTSTPTEEMYNIEVGIIVGVSMTMLCMFLFLIVFCILKVKRSSKKTEADDALLATNNGGGNSDYLYAEKLKELQAHSIDSSHSSTGITIPEDGKSKFSKT